MGHNAGHITAPVNTDDVRAVTGEASDDIGTLCISDKINRYAHDKPLNIDQPQDITDAQRTAANHGLVPTQALKSDGTFNLAEWGYTRPSATCMKRLTDFVGYIHTSKPPIYIISDEPDVAGCTVVTWDEGTTKIDDFKIVAGFLCGNTGVGPVAEIGIRMDELKFGAVSNIGNATFGLLQVAGSVKMYLGATKQFSYGSGEGPVCNFGTKRSGGAYNYIANNLRNVAVGSYIEVLPVIDASDFAASKTDAPNGGLYGFPIGKKLRIYHQKTEDWYMTGVVGNMTLYYVTAIDTGATVSCGTIHHNPGSLTDGINRQLPDAPDHHFYLIQATYSFRNNRSAAISLNVASFYLFIGNSIVASGQGIQVAGTSGFGTSVSIPANAAKNIVMRFQLTAREFNDKFPYVNPSGTIPVQSTTFALSYRNAHNVVTVRNASGTEITESWNFGFRVLK